MQSESKNIYNLTSTRTGIDEQIYKDIGNFVLKEVHNQLAKPKALINKLKGVGYWFLKRKRIQEVMSVYPTYYEIDGFKDFPSERAFLNFVDKQEIYKLFKDRLKDYDEYVRIKAEVNKKKDEFKKLHNSKENSNSSCQDNS